MWFMETFTVRTTTHAEFVEITHQIREQVDQSGIDTGVAHVFVPHTTAGIMVNENADPSVVHDMLADLDRLVPPRQPYYQHFEGNSASHLKASLMGSSVSILVDGGRLVLGTWQGIYLCEFDGPRTRKIHVQLVGGGNTE
jgi:secondary thiamine-phosphate synthase enzyme